MSNVKKNFIYNAIYNVLLMLLPLITTPYISRILGPSGIGTFSFTYSIVNYFMLFAMLGLKNYGNRSIAYVRNDKFKLSKKFWNIYGMQIITSLIIFCLYFIYIIIFVENYKLIALIQGIYILSCFVDINWFFFGIERFKLIVLRNIVIKLGTVISIFIFVKAPHDLWKYTMIMSCGVFLSNIAVWPFLQKFVYYIKPTKKEILKHLKPNIILFVPVIAVSLYKIMDKIMLGAMSTISQVGFYENSEKLINLPMGIILALGTVMLPRISHLVSQGDIQKSKEYIEYSMFFVTFMSVPMAFGLSAIAPVFAPLFFGAKFAPTVELIIYISITIIIISWANVIRTQYLIPNKKDKIYIISVFSGALINLLINLMLIPLYGAKGAVIGTIVAEFVVATIQTVFVRKKLDIQLYFKNAIPFIIIGFIMFVTVRFIGYLKINQLIILLLQIGVGITIYVLLSLIYFFSTNNVYFKQFILNTFRS